MEITAITHTNNTKSIQYGHQELAVGTGVSTYQYIDISLKQLEEIQSVATDKVQEVLSKLF